MPTFKAIVTNRLFRVAAVLIFVIAISVGCSKNSTGHTNNNGGGGNPGANEVWMQSTHFNPAARTVAVGTVITWTNKDAMTHTVTSGAPGSPNGTFDSGNMGANATFAHTFSAAGTFPYYCRIHGASMTGTITVQ